MKAKALLLSLCLFLLGALAPEPLLAGPVGGPIRVVITPDTTPEQLDILKEKMEEEGYVLCLEPVFENGELRSIRGTVNFGSAGSGNFCSGRKFSEIILQKKWLGGMSIMVKR